jgi:membrane protease YdiL (CAAX protease family)
MTALRFQLAAREPTGSAWAEVGLVLMALGAAVVVRLAATRAGIDTVGVGAGFGLALLAVVLARGGRFGIGPRPWRQAVAGTAFGLALVALALVADALAREPLVQGLARPASPFVPWAAVTIVVAVAEEAVLRGLLFDRVRRSGGTVVALGVTTVAFALMHVPLYGWHVVPLDLAVGLALGGLRIATRGLVAPAAAHVVADLATWWL